MKILSIVVLFISISSPAFSETLEFRKFTLDLGKNQKPLTTEQIKQAIDAHKLGFAKAIKIQEADRKFSYSNIKPVEYVSTYGANLSILEFETKNTGTIITGTTKQKDKHLEVTFSYEHSAKIKNMVYGTKGKQVILTPVFNTLKTSSTAILNRHNNQWSIFTIPSSLDTTAKTYIALRVRSKTRPREEEIIWEKE